MKEFFAGKRDKIAWFGVIYLFALTGLLIVGFSLEAAKESRLEEEGAEKRREEEAAAERARRSAAEAEAEERAAQRMAAAKAEARREERRRSEAEEERRRRTNAMAEESRREEQRRARELAALERERARREEERREAERERRRKLESRERRDYRDGILALEILQEAELLNEDIAGMPQPSSRTVEDFRSLHLDLRSLKGRLAEISERNRSEVVEDAVWRTFLESYDRFLVQLRTAERKARRWEEYVARVKGDEEDRTVEEERRHQAARERRAELESRREARREERRAAYEAKRERMQRLYDDF